MSSKPMISGCPKKVLEKALVSNGHSNLTFYVLILFKELYWYISHKLKMNERKTIMKHRVMGNNGDHAGTLLFTAIWLPFPEDCSLVGPKLVDKRLALRGETLTLLCGCPGSPPGLHPREASYPKAQVFPGPHILWAPPPSPHFTTSTQIPMYIIQLWLWSGSVAWEMLVTRQDQGRIACSGLVMRVTLTETPREGRDRDRPTIHPTLSSHPQSCSSRAKDRLQ